MQILKYLLWLICITAIAVVGGAVYLAQDANRFKPDIEALIAEHSDIKVAINGDLAWSLWPPVTFSVNNIEATQDDLGASAKRLDLKVDLRAMWQDVNAWKISSLTLFDTTITDAESVTQIHQATLTDFQPNEPASFVLDLERSVKASEDPPTTAQLKGLITYTPPTANEPYRLSFTETEIQSNLGAGTCKGDITERISAPKKLPDAQPEDLLPIALLLSYNAVVDCGLTKLVVGDETFNEGSLELTNVEGETNAHLKIDDFLGGGLIVDADIDATRTPVRWTVHPEMDGVDSQRLVDWSKQNLVWAAPLALDSTVEMQGNTEDELIHSLKASGQFDGGQGVLDVSKIKEQLMRLALFTNKSEKVAGWPDLLNYESMLGTLNIEGTRHQLNFALDNLRIEADGIVDYLADSVDLRGTVTVNEAPEDSPISINELLVGTPIPMRCRGTAAEPECRLDNDAAKQVVANALTRGDASGLRKKIDKKIDEEVPEEYQETAREILDLLGRALDRD